MATFADLLRELSATDALGSPVGEYQRGLGLAAYTLVRVMVDPDAPPAAKIQAAKDVADRIEGKARQAERLEAHDLRLSDLDRTRLTAEEWDTLERILIRALPADKQADDE